MQNHESWLAIAQEDLSAAKALQRIELFSAVTYHSQQAAEKSLKAYLVYKSFPIIKIHDLVQLIELCMKTDKEFSKILDEGEKLNPFSSKFRYPTEFDIPDKELTIKQAQAIMKLVSKKIMMSPSGQISII